MSEKQSRQRPDFRIKIASHPDEPECVAEIWFGDVQVAMLSFGPSDELLIEIFGPERGGPHRLNADRYTEILGLAREQLVDRRAPKTDTSRYEQLLMLFTSGLMPLEDYQRHYFDAFKSDIRMHRTSVHEVLSRLFTDLDVFNPDPSGRLEYEIGLEELMASAKTGLKELRTLR